MAESAVTSYSLVIPVYRNEETLSDLLAVAANLSKQSTRRSKSSSSWTAVPTARWRSCSMNFPQSGLNAKVIEMSRNFGAFAAIRAGLAEASGPYFAVMAADLQEPPELALDFFRKLAADACDVVIGVREGRDDALHVRASSALFWRAYRRLVQPYIPAGGIDVFGCNRVARDQLVALSEAHSSLVGLLIWIGLRREEVRYRRLPRRHGKSAWTLRKKLAYMFDSCLSFSDLPIRLLFGVGMLLAAAIIYGGIVVFARATGLIQEPGYATTVLLVAGFGALNALGLSVVGAYAWRAFENTKARPLAIVQRRFSLGRASNGEIFRAPAGAVRIEGHWHGDARLGVRPRSARRAHWSRLQHLRWYIHRK
jgi:glycosyltransferase involved in cell wall biosynthesis